MPSVLTQNQRLGHVPIGTGHPGTAIFDTLLSVTILKQFAATEFKHWGVGVFQHFGAAISDHWNVFFRGRGP